MAPPPAGPGTQEEGPHVTAVLVSHDGAAWLPEVLSALAAQTRRPDQVVAVDTGSRDASPRLLVEALGSAALVTLPRLTGFGAAVRAGLAAQEVPPGQRLRQQWVWVLHDDCAPAADALERLLAHAQGAPGVGVLGPKVLDWDDPRRLVEVGLTTDAAGRRETGLEPGELDQGQHDSPREVLAVGTAGALVRREVFDQLGGFASDLPLLREDIDFGWRANLAGHRVAVVPSAELRHVRASLRARRGYSAAPVGRRLDRRHALFVLAVNSPRGLLLPVVVRLVIGALLRALAYLLTRRPAQAADELLAAGSLLAAPAGLWRGRRGRAATRRLPARAVRPLLARPGRRMRHGLEALADWVTGGAAPAAEPGGALESGPSDEELPPAVGASRLRRLATRPGVVLVAALTLVSLVTDRHLLAGGTLSGGRLLPAPASAHALWASYLSSWHAGVVGSDRPAPPWEPLLAGAGTLLGGSVARAMALLLVLALPAAAATAYRASWQLTRSIPLRLVAATSYAYLSGLPAAVAEGRFDVVVAGVALPVLLVSGARLFATGAPDGRSRRPWALVLELAATAAFAPQVLPAALVLLVMAAVASGGPGRARRAGVALGVVAAVLVLLEPWTLTALRHPSVFLAGLGAGAGRAGTATVLTPARLLLLSPGGARGLPPAALAAPLLVAALAALARSRRGGVLAGWVIAAAGLAGALAAARTAVAPGTGYPGVGLALAAAGLLAAAVAGADGAHRLLARHAFGWRQPVAVLLAAAAALAPLAAAGLLLGRGGGDPVRRTSATLLPAFALADAAATPGARVLELTAGPPFAAPPAAAPPAAAPPAAAPPAARPPAPGRARGGGADRSGRGRPSAAGQAGTVFYSLGPAGGARLGEEDYPPSPAAARLLGAAATGLAAPLGTDAAAALATFDVRYVAVPEPAPAPLVAALDAQSGLSRVSSSSGALLWQVVVPTARLQVDSGALAALALDPAPPGAASRRGPTTAALQASPPLLLPTGPQGAAAVLPAGPPDRLLVLSDAAEPGWQATVDGHPLAARTAWGWAQAFRLPATGGLLRLRHLPGARPWELAGELAALLVVLVLAAPDLGVEAAEIDPAGRGADRPLGAAA